MFNTIQRMQHPFVHSASHLGQFPKLKKPLTNHLRCSEVNINQSSSRHLAKKNKQSAQEE